MRYYLPKNAAYFAAKIRKKRRITKLFRFYRPIHHIVGVYISRCCCYHTDDIHAGEGSLPGVACQIKHCRREQIRAKQPCDENQDKGYAQFAHVAPVLAAQMAAGCQGGDDGNQTHRAFCPDEYARHLGNLPVLHHRYKMKIEALAQDE